MTEPQAMKLIAYLKAAFPKQEIREDTFMVYVEALLPLDADVAARAVRRHTAMSAFWPAISELLGAVAQERVAVEPAEQAWGSVTRAISAWGRYRDWKFTNPITQVAVDAITKDVICNSENLGIERAHFLRIYASYRDAELSAARASSMLGEAYEPPRLRAGEPKGIAGVLRLVTAKESG